MAHAAQGLAARLQEGFNALWWGRWRSAPTGCGTPPQVWLWAFAGSGRCSSHTGHQALAGGRCGAHSSGPVPRQPEPAALSWSWTSGVCPGHTRSLRDLPVGGVQRDMKSGWGAVQEGCQGDGPAVTTVLETPGGGSQSLTLLPPAPDPGGGVGCPGPSVVSLGTMRSRLLAQLLSLDDRPWGHDSTPSTQKLSLSQGDARSGARGNYRRRWTSTPSGEPLLRTPIKGPQG